MLALALGPTAAGAAEPRTQTPPAPAAQVVALAGTATYQVGTNPPVAVRPGTRLAEGWVVRTGPGSALDLALGKRAGVVRLAENSALLLEQLPQESADAASPVQLRLSLQAGTLLGLRNGVTLADRFEVKFPQGAAAIGANLFRIEARGYVVVLSGKVLLAHAPPGLEPVVHRLEAPPAVYFSPHEGVRPAPPELDREVRLQCLPRLRSSAPSWGDRQPLRLEPPGTPRLGPWPHADRGAQPAEVELAQVGPARPGPGLARAGPLGGSAAIDWPSAPR